MKMAKYTDSKKTRNLLSRAKELSKEKGFFYVVRAGFRRAFINPLSYRYCKYFKSDRTFTFGGDTYRYFIHKYNTTWRNERAVELPIIWKIVKKYQGKRILEVGNVLSHYFHVDHDILDKYERSEGVINQDVVDFQPSEKYDLIVSISTLEHVGWDETPREPLKILRAIKNLKSILAPKGKLVITLPLGHNSVLDELLRKGKIQFTRMYCLKRISRDNLWVETNWKDIEHVQYDSPFNNANGLVIGIIDKK
ncbi:hypothetical protein D6764_00045 [Candidatus Woesearchaeota archaeon]|nr:MAG: hypothetical protein D6764_00045 [Candidatus Woesearchaeota archaeon]